MWRTCPECENEFQPKGDWQYRCTPCWVEEKEQGIRNAAEQVGYRRGLEEGRRMGVRQTGPSVPSGIWTDAKFLLDLITLTHPDHQPSERASTANRVTARLNEALDQARKTKR